MVFNGSFPTPAFLCANQQLTGHGNVRGRAQPEQWMNRRELNQKRSWWALKDLNLRPTDYESAALTAELRARSIALRFYRTAAARRGPATADAPVA
ncbi:hypothetical protein SBA6_500008 [Candidatus Sulfopaludibacter sp. SbA6]|nr:hypothetical protein SBA6_500008 [Candidatus Sulfopaludibacter sp. SbA6]